MNAWWEPVLGTAIAKKGSQVTAKSGCAVAERLTTCRQGDSCAGRGAGTMLCGMKRQHAGIPASRLCRCAGASSRPTGLFGQTSLSTHTKQNKHESFRLPLSSPKRVVLVLRNAIQAVKNQILLLFYFWLWHCCSVLLRCYRTMRHRLACSQAPRTPMFLPFFPFLGGDVFVPRTKRLLLR